MHHVHTEWESVNEITWNHVTKAGNKTYFEIINFDGAPVTIESYPVYILFGHIPMKQR